MSRWEVLKRSVAGCTVYEVIRIDNCEKTVISDEDITRLETLGLFANKEEAQALAGKLNKEDGNE